MKKNKVKRQNLLIVFILIAGLLVLFYPTYSNWINQFYAKKMITNYEHESKDLSENSREKLYKAAVKYNQKLAKETIPASFAKRMGIKNDKNYESQLDVTGDGILGCVNIPSINVSLPIYHYTSKEILEKGAGHLFGSSLPVGGKNTHTVITAHRGLPSARMFTDLDELRTGDRFYLEVLGHTLAYEVDKIKTVKPDETSDLRIEKKKDFASLVTCTPYGQNTHRLVVRGHRIPYKVGDEKEQSAHHRIPWMHILCILLGIFIAWMIYFIATKKKRRNEKNLAEYSDKMYKSK
ncbi:class C sortase [Hornefia porci]|uniref:Class C sortase n=1 Tax=Hornefia porci TaxID=2652292 RepID=A0A1Q9JG01_9FIRM|nr:class C sortase [Hornefia porci]OLR55077.1 class C sortase [Hornefia porci]